MSYIQKFLLVAPVALISACSSSSGGDYTNSSFATPSSAGTFSGTLNNEREGSDNLDTRGGYAYRAGTTSADGAIAQSGLLPNTNLATPPVNGSATFTGTYEIAKIEDISVSNSVLSGNVSVVTSPISLTANYTNDTLRGSGGNLTVNGTMNGRALGGSVTYQGIQGNLTGQVGPAAAIGAFHGNNTNTVYAGGFAVD